MYLESYYLSLKRKETTDIYSVQQIVLYYDYYL